MKPGRELDALVDEEVMGFCMCPHDRRWLTSPDTEGFEGSSVWSDEGVWRCTKHHKIVGGKARSTDIAAAWEVLEKLGNDGWAWTVETTTTHEISATFWEGDRFHVGYAKTAPHAICLAARRVVEAATVTDLK